MYDLTQIKLRAEVSTIYNTEQHPQGIRGFIHWTGKQAIWCLPAGDGYTWITNGRQVRESTVVSLLADQQ